MIELFETWYNHVFSLHIVQLLQEALQPHSEDVQDLIPSFFDSLPPQIQSKLLGFVKQVQRSK